MRTIKIITIALTLTLGIKAINAQQAPMYTHYMYNTLSVNPAYAGSRDALTITALHRSQWVSFKGAPMTQTLTMHAPLKNEHIGLGLSASNDRIGPINNTSVFGNFAYILKLTPKSKLAFGLSAGANILQANLSTLQLDNQSDPTFQKDISNRVTPNFGFGAYYYREKFYVGLSIPNILENNYLATDQVNGAQLLAKEQRHYFLIAGTMIEFSENVALKPTMLVKVTSAVPIQADLTASFIFMKRFLIGGMFRSGDAFGVLAGLDITKQFHLGYSFDWSYGLKTSVYNNGSHELVLRYDFLTPNKKQIHTPRNF
ncbi:MAG: type IX secretion system membrane protein PorP/SprF [Bacteroidetes bacterium]|nr:type IX secretion system membrane protein PorP/SprF [Bacteroidota bacterium]